MNELISMLTPYWQALMQWLSQPVQLQLDLAAAAIAVVALVASRRAARNQERLSVESLRIQRDNDVIQWTNGVIDMLVAIEFHLRDWARNMQPQQFVAKRDEFLGELSATIDKGRLYFPHFAMDVIGPRTSPPPPVERQAILDRMVDIYDVI